MARVEVHCRCGKIYVHGEGESSFEGYLPLPPREHYTSDTCSECRPDLDSDRIKPEEFGKLDVRDNRRAFKPKVPVSDGEFPEFLDDADFFDAHTLIEI